ncbi:RNA-binding S4 domain-containing protein [Limosilactobacillus gastricus]|uniref:RQC P-site tRNA stabilizing factor n=1 Tax=Limosilactobacillus gastricus DSM 16045 TaxID=1423749 RepID=A0A0R1V563_9LACO|nr:RNA-binding S4 domain-containing protein [Limosilactobacillus gastricus]KRM00712.1 Ribosome-associated heat shock protein implicated in the recycling of the 50S subunit [Limosilactobacillus gastricus DSM 16045]QGF40963.1 RNA-binding S4 domain-containing protein [Limosilactobacillus gastricus]
MRLDKYLKISRIIKRRPIAKKIADQGRIMINDKVAKSSSSVVTGDKVTIKFGNKTLVVKVKQLLDSTKKEDAEQMYEILEEKYEQDFREI